MPHSKKKSAAQKAESRLEDTLHPDAKRVVAYEQEVYKEQLALGLKHGYLGVPRNMWRGEWLLWPDVYDLGYDLGESERIKDEAARGTLVRNQSGATNRPNV